VLGQPRTLELGVDVAATGLDKYGVTGPRLGLLGGRRELVDAIRARAIELGVEARPLFVPAVVHSLERYRQERVRELVATTQELGDALERRLGPLVTRTPFALKLRGDDLLREAPGAQAVPVEATAAVAMQLLRDHGLLTVHFAAVPPGTPDLLLKFVPPETLASLGGAEALAALIADSVERSLPLIADLDRLRKLLFGAPLPAPDRTA
jgi:L-seryl-tRNA(Ser) seleniumtransferase